MKQLKDFFIINKDKDNNYFLRKLWCSRAFYYKLKNKIFSWKWNINPNKLAKVYDKLWIQRDLFFQKILESYYKDTWNTLRKLRIKRRLTLNELAEKTKLAVKTIVRVENNKKAAKYYTIDCILEVLRWHWKKTLLKDN